MREIKLPNSGPVSVEVIAGHNNAASYLVALWNPKTSSYQKIGEGLASYQDPDPDTFKLPGSIAALRGKTLVVRAYLLPYPPSTPPFHLGVKLSDGNGTEFDVLENDWDAEATGSLVGVFK